MTETAKDSIVTDIGAIWARLFDHKPFLHGEIQFMLKEFQERRLDSEVERLFNILEHSTDIKDTQIDRMEQRVSANLPVLQTNIEEALNICCEINQQEEQYKSDKTLVENRVARKKEWEVFIEDMTHKCTRVDNTFEEKEEELQEFYSDLERKLHINK